MCFVCPKNSSIYLDPASTPEINHKCWEAKAKCCPNHGTIACAIRSKERIHVVSGIVTLVFRAQALTTKRYYTMSVILGTVALSYGSVPMYKMVGHLRDHWSRSDRCL